MKNIKRIMNETNNKKEVKKIKWLKNVMWKELTPRIILTVLNVAVILPIVIGSNLEVFSDYHAYIKTVWPLKERKEIKAQYLGDRKFKSLTRGNEFYYKIPEYKLLGVKKGDIITIDGIREYDTLTEKDQKMVDNKDIINPGTRIYTATILSLVVEGLLLLIVRAFKTSDNFLKPTDSIDWISANEKMKKVVDIISFSPFFLFLGLSFINLVIYTII